MNYEQAGVSVKKADALTEIIKKTVKTDNIGMFAGIVTHPALPDHYLVACTDGVGSKIIPLLERKQLETIAIDLVAMNLNDMICCGARPLFFLDYIATPSLDVPLTSQFIKHLHEVLDRYNCLLAGGETAELPDIIIKDHFDVAGFSVGLVKKNRLLKKENVRENDIIVGLKSSGPHSNGYTLIRKLFENGLLTREEFETSLKPTYIYVDKVLQLIEKDLIHACAHITGGGLADNLARAIPEGLTAKINKNNIPSSQLFKKLESITGSIEAFNTFNMGVGMCLIAPEKSLHIIQNICNPYEPFVLGVVETHDTNKRVIYLD
jgi:phosphoribosylaminoimidazole synthetase